MEFNKETMPRHIAIILDGNRRWARERGKTASFGHKEGAKTLEKIVRYANKIGLEYITVYAFFQAFFHAVFLRSAFTSDRSNSS